MKKSSFSLKLIAAIIFFAMGALLILNGLSGFDYSGSYEDQKTYGGDAYTGIQNAAAQGANNINSLAYLIRDIAEVSYLVLGMVLIAVGCYVLARAIDVKSTPSQTLVYKAPDTPDTSSENQTPPTDTQKKEQEPTAVEQPPQQPAYQPPQQPAYQPPQQPAYQPPQQPAYQPPQQPAYQPPRQATTTQAAPPQGSRASAELARYQSLLTRGIITQEEFDQKKKQLLG